MNRIVVTSVLLLISMGIFSQERRRENPPRRGAGESRPESFFYQGVPSHDYDLILFRPEDKSVTISIVSYKPAEAYLEYFIQAEKPIAIERFVLSVNDPREVIFHDLKPGRRYTFHLFYRKQGSDEFIKSPAYYFRTLPAKGADISFTLTADSHLDENCDTLVYQKTLLNAVTDSADFHIDLGDTFMTDKFRNNYKDASSQYLAQRYYFGLLCHSSPLFLVPGNHDGESGSRLNGSEDNMTVWSTRMRNRYFLCPVPDGFYTGNALKEPFTGLPQNYYAWEWGNALFIVLDPFRFSTGESGNDPWKRTLGKDQYLWLHKTLAGSRATFKFVFLHNLVGGADINGRARGGAEAAGFYEWGGKNPDGTDGFKIHRPDWEMPVHDLLKKYRVNAVFHGHDHMYANQEYDGIIYQCVPQPGAKNSARPRPSGEYGYKSGIILNGPGYLRVRLTGSLATVSYLKTDPSSEKENKKINHEYQIKK